MATDVDIGNMALGHLGTRATIADLTENSTEAREISRWYVTVRDTMIRKLDWNFARVYIALAELGTPPSRWGYSYAYPSDCLKFWRIDTGISVLAIDPAVTFEVGSDGASRFIWTNYAQAVGVYSQRVTDPNRFDPEFTMAFSTALAAMVALPITQKVDIRNSLQATAIALIDQAKADSANEQVNNEAERMPESIAVRGFDDLTWLNNGLGRVIF